MPAPKVSIVVPVYNGSNYMRDAIDSALSQTWSEIEVVVVNDGSRDEGATEAIARSYGDRIRYVSKPNGGVASALNAGIEAMTGDVFCWCSHDDMHLPEKTERQIAKWQELGRPDCVLYADYRLIDAAGTPMTEVRMDHGMLSAKPIYALLRGSVHGCSVFVPRRLFDAIGRFDERLPTTQDYDLWFRMARSIPFIHMPEVLVLSRWHEEQGSKKADYRPEATRLWRKMMDGLSRNEQIALEGSVRRFYLGMAKFLRANSLDQAALHAETRAEQARNLVSVVLPVRDHAEMAISALHSVVAQSHSDLEVLVFDCGLSSAQAKLLTEHISAFPRVRLIRSAAEGPDGLRAAIAEIVTGEYLAFIKPSDLFAPHKISTQVDEMEREGAAFSYSRYWLWDTASGRIARGQLSGRSEGSFRDPALGLEIEASTVMIRRDLFADPDFSQRALTRPDAPVAWLELSAKAGILELVAPLSTVRMNAMPVSARLQSHAEALSRAAGMREAQIDPAGVAGPELGRLKALAEAARLAANACGGPR